MEFWTPLLSVIYCLAFSFYPFPAIRKFKVSEKNVMAEAYGCVMNIEDQR